MDKIISSFKPSSLDGITDVNKASFELFGMRVDVNVTTIVMTWITMIIIIILGWIFGRRLTKIPGRGQCLLEALISFFASLIKEVIGEGGTRYLPFIVTIFLFVLFSNWLSIIPPLKNPTSDLNTTLGLGLMVFFVAHASGFLKKGILGHLRGFLEPIFIAPLALVINVFGELGKTISHSFRLFGNILGGGLIFLVIFEMPNYLGPILYKCLVGKLIHFGIWPIFKIVIPIGLNLFFGLFVGTIQAFVFTILAIAYISMARE